ncbi:MAG: flagellar type III secretion system pore protein FliP [Halorhodospira halophila]|uniref:flagellar type III secretion system pore protein FliP n=1 Tax=Halorhodospira TaxID=85108 RepID=UPI001914D4CD|nr:MULTISPECIES: flagellar type III secretion system pore protein FliP [Halorhodospira]MBK5936749.1 flagellar biosynthetic protein FliP [Halorhodospira halophila]MBK5942807.1 flagellar biosynthetic protein FliP [Halorhodospira halophila]MCC3751690.1 flagellar type III secretion system pore protein FliP [Halorhodospira halophila]MCG5528824.1 flagellar type III secretion system pore protein FliP [Halorhodospira halophila]MCG5533717.1 flagellar type III secretion system pore protein FliP [Halorho
MPTLRILLLVALFLCPVLAYGQTGLEALTIEETEDGQTWSLSVQVLVLMTLLTLLPAMVLMMTAFTRIIVVLAILRQALGTASTPSNQVLIGLALFLTLFVMMPVFDEINETALQPYMAEEMNAEQALEQASEPMREFMIRQTREDDIALFLRIADYGEVDSPDDVPMSVLIPAFMTSELKTAFIIGFVLYLPFLVIDLVVASTLMSMGMLMLSPMIISLPFKIMLFVLVDGWSLVMGTLASSFFL